MTDLAAPAVQQVVQALNVLYQDPDPNAKERANAWLSLFQKSDDAWSTSQLLLFAPDAPLEGKLFAAQTFRTKITYDFDRLPAAHRIPLRDSLLTALRSFSGGPKVILTQLCIALADLALQLSSEEWADPASAMIESFGKEPQLAGVLLEFLQVLAEEFGSNFKLDVKSDFGRGNPLASSEAGRGETMRAQSKQLVSLLSMYVGAPGITPELKKQCFSCLASWLRTGQTAAASVAGSPLLAVAFASLDDEDLFENAVDVLVDFIHETQELDDNMVVIQELLPQLIALQPKLLNPENREDEDKMRGYCRILVEAGELYESLIVKHQASFLPLVESIAILSAYDNLNVVSITINFWFKLSSRLRGQVPTPERQPLFDIFTNLVGTIIRHLHYPIDDSTLVGQERDDFRSFRHSIGDTLKDCCTVLGASTCLLKAYDIISAILAAPGESRWQDIEAPLFAMRSMGARVHPSDDEVMPQIMDLIPTLPQHPKIRYAAILVIGRYTEWVNRHPQYIQFQLPYVSEAFSDPDPDVSAAAGQTLKYLCKECSTHLVAFLPQLHDFVQSVTSKLAPEYVLDLSIAIAHIISVMPSAERAQALSTFCMPNIAVVHTVANKATPATKEEVRAACDALQCVDMFLAIVELHEAPPLSCQASAEQIWAVLDTFLANYGTNPEVAEKTCIAVRRGLVLFGECEVAVKLAPAILDRLADAFVRAPVSSFLWITGKIVSSFAWKDVPALVAMMGSAFDRESQSIFTRLQSSPPNSLSDSLVDYAHLLQDVVEFQPSLLFLSPSFPGAFQTALSTLTIPKSDIIGAALDAIRAVVGHECLQSSPSDFTGYSSPPFAHLFPSYELAIRPLVAAVSVQLVGLLLDTLVEGPEEVSSSVLTLFRLLSIQFEERLVAAIPPAVENLSIKIASPSEKMEFLNLFNTAMGERNPSKVKESLTWLLRTSRKSRNRARVVTGRD